MRVQATAGQHKKQEGAEMNQTHSYDQHLFLVFSPSKFPLRRKHLFSLFPRSAV